MSISQTNPVNSIRSQTWQPVDPGSGNNEVVKPAKAPKASVSSAEGEGPKAKDQPKPPTKAELEKTRSELEAKARQISAEIVRSSKQLVSSLLFEGLLRQQEQIEADAKRDRVEAQGGPSIADTDSPIPMSELFALNGRRLPQKIADLSSDAVDVQVRIDKVNSQLDKLNAGPKASAEATA